MIDGFEIRVSALLTVTRTRPRSWRERLLTWPWRPWLSHEICHEPDPRVYKLGHQGRQILIAHPAVAAVLREKLREKMH